MILNEFRINNQEKVPKEKPLAAPVQGMCTLCLLWFIPNYITMKKIMWFFLDNIHEKKLHIAFQNYREAKQSNHMQI